MACLGGHEASVTDNVNKIDIENAGDGTNTIEITHIGSLTGGGQDFSLVVQGLQQ